MKFPVASPLIGALLMSMLGIGCAASETWIAESEADPFVSAGPEPTMSTSERYQRPVRQDVPTEQQERSSDVEQLIRTVSHSVTSDNLNQPAEDPDADAMGLVFPRIEESADDAAELTADEPMATVVDAPETVASIEGITVETLEEIALQNNPAIRQASAAAGQACGIRTQVGLKPNPTLGYFGEEIGNGGSAGIHGAYVSQMFVRGDKLCWNQQVIEHDVQALLWEVEAQRVRVRTDIRLRFFDALAAQRRAELAREFRKVAGEGVALADNRLQAGFGNKADVLQSEIQVNEVDLLIRRAEVDLDGAWRAMAAIAGVSGMSPTRLVGSLSASASDRDAESAFNQIVSSSPVIQAAHQRVDRARKNLQRQHVEPIPNVTANLGTGYDDDTGDSFANMQFNFSLPVRNRNQGNIQAAQSELHTAIQNVERLRLQVRANLATAFRDYLAAEATVEQYETAILPKAVETLTLMNEAKAAGQFDFFRVLSARRAYFDAQLKQVEAQADLGKAIARIDGMLLSGSLSTNSGYDGNDDLRGQTLSGQ